MYGPYRPFCAVISSPSGPTPSTRGRVSSRSASSRVTVSIDIDANRLDVRARPGRTYGPYRPALTVTSSPVSGSVPSTRSPDGASNSSSTFSLVSSSGGRSSGTLARAPSSPRSRYGP